LKKIVKINFLMFRKIFLVYGFLNIMKAICLVGIVVVLPKTLLFFIPQKVILTVYILLCCMIVGLPLADVSYVEMSHGHKKLLTYFKHISAEELKQYYTYRKFILFILLIVYVYFPLSFEVLPHSLFIVSLIGIALLIKTSVQYIVKNEGTAITVRNGLQVMFVALFFLIGHNIVDSSYVITIITQVPVYYFAFLILLCYTVIYINVGRSYLLQQTSTSATLRVGLIKNHHLLYVLRTGLIMRLAMILAFSLLAIENPVLTALGFSLTVLTSYLTIYYSLLRNDEGKIQLFYEATKLYKIRYDKIVITLKISLVYFLLAIGLGLYTGEIVPFILAYIMTTSVFALGASIIKINIEKRQDNKILTWQDFVKISLFCTTSVGFLASLL